MKYDKHTDPALRLTIWKRTEDADKYVTVIKFKGKGHWLTLAETQKDSFKIAIRARREIQEGRWDTVKTAVQLRTPVAQTTVAELLEAYVGDIDNPQPTKGYRGHDRPADTTRRQNAHALRQLLTEAGRNDKIPLTDLTDKLLWTWRETKRQAAAKETDDERQIQLLRSANSRLRQARSVLSDNADLRTYYRAHGITLPPNIAAFNAEPGFEHVAKEEYHAPSDTIIAATFKALEQLNPEGPVSSPGVPPQAPDRNMYVAIWIAIGFGLRKSEISKAKNAWFVNINGAIYCRGDELAKNKKFPEVRCQLGAWAKLAPHIAGQPADAYVLQGDQTERTEETFRRISDWMRGLGWQTQHHIHEFRAWSGCQIAMARDLRAAQTFLRHAHFATTEKHYGHHLKIRLDEVPINLPTTPTPAAPSPEATNIIPLKLATI
jgi:integrase